MVQSNFIQFGENCDDPEDFGGNPFSDQPFFLVLADRFGPLRFGGCAHGVHGDSPGWLA